MDPAFEPAQRAREAPPPHAEDEEPAAAAVPPTWQEVAPGVHHGLPDGSGEVVLLKVRCPRCEQAFTLDQLDGGEVPEHSCQLAYDPIDPRPRSPGNLGGYFRRRRHREAIPPEVQAELTRMASERPTPEQIAAELERAGVARAGPPAQTTASTNGHTVPAGG